MFYMEHLKNYGNSNQLFTPFFSNENNKRDGLRFLKQTPGSRVTYKKLTKEIFQQISLLIRQKKKEFGDF